MVRPDFCNRGPQKFFTRGRTETGDLLYDSDTTKYIKHILVGILLTDFNIFQELHILFISPKVYLHNILFLFYVVVFLYAVYQLN